MSMLEHNNNSYEFIDPKFECVTQYSESEFLNKFDFEIKMLEPTNSKNRKKISLKNNLFSQLAHLNTIYRFFFSNLFLIVSHKLQF